MLRHGLKNALIPLVTIVALSLPGLVAGAIVTESIFAWPGMGRLFFNALGQFDFSLLMGYLMMVSVLVVLLQLVGRRRVRVARPAREVRLGADDRKSRPPLRRRPRPRR